MCVPPPPQYNWILDMPENRRLAHIETELLEAEARRLQAVLEAQEAVVAARRRRRDELAREAREAAEGAQN